MRSLASCINVPARPTIVNCEKPFKISASTLTTSVANPSNRVNYGPIVQTMDTPQKLPTPEGVGKKGNLLLRYSFDRATKKFTPTYLTQSYSDLFYWLFFFLTPSANRAEPTTPITYA